MAHILFPSDYATYRVLQKAMFKKHADDDKKSDLTHFFSTKKIDPATDLLAGTNADKEEDNRVSFTVKSEKATLERDHLLVPLMKNQRKFGQALKRTFASNVKELGEWSIPVTVKGRIDYNGDFSDTIAIIIAVIQKHLDLKKEDKASPLDVYVNKGVDFAAELANANKAKDFDDQRISFAAQAKLATEQRDLLWKTPQKNINDTGGFLLTVHSDSPNLVSAWGFNIINSTTVAKSRKVTIDIAKTVTVSSVLINSVLAYEGSTPFSIYKGKKASGEAVVIKSGDKITLLKGYSSFTVINPSTSDKLVFTLTPPAK